MTTRTVELTCHACGERFERFASQTVSKRTGRPFSRAYCSPKCQTADRDARRVELTCDTCGKAFSRPVSLTIDPRTGEPFARQFCSRACLQSGVLVPCAVCGKEVRRIPAELDHEHVCCSRTCTAQLRRQQGLPQLVAPNWGGKARQTWGGRWNATKAPKPGKLPRGRERQTANDEQKAEILKLSAAGWGRRAIANRTQLSERLVRNTLEN